MKSLAFLFVASILFLFVGLLISEGQTPPPASRAVLSIPAAPPPKPAAAGSAKQVVRPAPTPKPEKSALAEALAADDLCGAGSILDKAGFAAAPAEIRGVLRAFGAPSDLQAMFAADGPLYGPADPKKKFSSTFLKFVFALRLGGLTEHMLTGNSPLNKKAALALLKELEKEDPANGAYPYFQLGVIPDEEENKNEIWETAERVAHASYFDSMLVRQLAQLEAARWQSPTHFYLLDWLSPKLQRFGYHRALRAINILAGMPGENELKDKISDLFLKEVRSARQRAEYHGFDAEAYAYGTIFHRGQTPSVHEVSESISGWAWKYPPFISGRGICKREAFDAYYEEMRGRP